MFHQKTVYLLKFSRMKQSLFSYSVITYYFRMKTYLILAVLIISSCRYADDYCKVSNHVSYFNDGMNIIKVEKNGKMLFINAPHFLVKEAMKQSRAKLSRVVCLNYRSSMNGGIAMLDVPVAAPQKHQSLFTDPLGHLADTKNFFLVMDFHPDHDILENDHPVDLWLEDGSVIDFEGIKIRFLEMQGDTNGELACIIEDNIKVGVCGDMLCDDGKIPFLYRAPGRDNPYMRYLGRWKEIIASIEKLEECEIIIPARGIALDDKAIVTFKERLETVFDNYAFTSSAAWHAINVHNSILTDKPTMPFAEQINMPENIVLTDASRLIIAKNGRGFIVDCGLKETMDKLEELTVSGRLKGIDGCFVTHYHYDHADLLNRLHDIYGCKIMTTKEVADVLDNTFRYLIPATPRQTVKTEVLPEGYTWQWEEYTLSAFFFPGQTLYHAALLVDNGTSRLLFVGDSFSPSGMDNYCPLNRNFVEGNRGFSYCLNVIERLKPTAILAQHRTKPFIYTPATLATLRQGIAERLPLLKEVTPWSAPEVALDPQWLRVYPYYNVVKRGGKYTFQLQATSHWTQEAELTVKFTATGGITPPQDVRLTMTGLTSGFVDSEKDPDQSVGLSVDIPPDFPKECFAIGCHVWVNNQYWGEMSKGIFTIE